MLITANEGADWGPFEITGVGTSRLVVQDHAEKPAMNRQSAGVAVFDKAGSHCALSKAKSAMPTF